MTRIVVVAAVSVVAALGVDAAAVSGGGAAEEQLFAATDKRVVVKGKRWHTLRGLTVQTSCADRPAATAGLTLQLRGAARRADIRVARDGLTVVGDEPAPLQPGRVRTRVRKAPTTAAFSFVRSSVVDGHGERLRAQVRSPSGRRLVIRKGSLVVIWDPSSGPCQ